MASHVPQANTTATATARRALLETISEREKELCRIRDAAEKIVEEEQLASTQHLQTLQSDLLQHEKLLQDKDDLIQKLHAEIDYMKQDYDIYRKEVIDRSNEEVERKIEKIKNRLEKDYNDSLSRHEARERKRLQMEFEDKFMSCEKRLHGDYQESLLTELQKQEELLWSNFEKITSDKQSRYDKREKELCETLSEKEKDMAELSTQYEKSLHLSQTKLLSELQLEIESFARKNDEYKRKNEILSSEKEGAIEKYRCIEQELFDVERENSLFKDRMQELLEVIRGAEKSYVAKVEQFEQDKSEQSDQLTSMSKNIATLKSTLKKLKTSHREEIKALRNKRSQEKKSLQCTIEELRYRLEETEKDKSREAELAKINILRKDKEMKSLMEELDKCRQTVKKNEEKITLSEKQEYLLKQELEKKCENAVRQETDAQEHKALLYMEKTKFGEKLRAIAREKDLAEENRETCAIEVTRLKKEMAKIKLQNDSTILTLKEEKASIYQENRKLQLNLDEASREVVRLKENISKMREEMEAFVTAPSPCSQHNKPSTSTPKIGDSDEDTILSEMRSISERLTKSSKKDYYCRLPELNDAMKKISKSLGYVQEMKEKNAPITGDAVSMPVDERIEKLRKECQELSSELSIASSERKNLIELSNKLKADVSRLKLERNTILKTELEGLRNEYIKSDDRLGGDGDHEDDADADDNNDDIDVKDLAKSLWSKAIHSGEHMSNVPIKISERGTKSQKASLQKLRRTRNKKSELLHTEAGNGKKKVRNWNNREDYD